MCFPYLLFLFCLYSASSMLPTVLSTTVLSDWDQKNYDDKNTERKGAYWINSIGAKQFNYYA